MPEPSFANISPPRGSRPRSSRRDGRAAFMMAAPNLLMFGVFVVVPIVLGLLLSFTKWRISQGNPQWVGLDNYKAMFDDPTVAPYVGPAIVATLKFLLFGVVPTVFISLGLAMLINVRFRFIGVLRSLYLIPAAMSFAASAVAWRYLYKDSFGYGIINQLIADLGINPPDWLVSNNFALPALDIITIWLTLPTATILYLAALQRIPASVIEAATLDGAGPFRRVRYIIWPGVRYMTILVAIVALLAFTNGSFDLVNIVTKGNPPSTQTLIYYIYYEGFNVGNTGLAAALSVVQIGLIGGILVVLRLVSKVMSR